MASYIVWSHLLFYDDPCWSELFLIQSDFKSGDNI